MLRYDDLQVFVHTSDSGSLSAAARQLEISPAVASAALKRLESELEVRLFARSTRSLRLTPEGDAFLLHARASLRSLEEGRRLLQGGKDQIAGVLQLSAPSDFGRNLLLLWLDEFQARYPQLSLRLLLPEWQGEATPMNLLCTHRAQLTRPVTLLRAFVRERCDALLAEAPWTRN
ncbi:LysR family transcriptional regulator [Pseudomonas aeruginosa]|nr:LysR family transcriptional regulator [Pseudomonas aeruginosa]